MGIIVSILDKQFKEIRRAVISRELENMLKTDGVGEGERGGFLYGLEKGNDVYLASSLPYTPWREKRAELDFGTEIGEKFSFLHNTLVWCVKDRFPDFIQVFYHNHVNLSTEEIIRFFNFQINRNCNKYVCATNSALSKEDLECSKSSNHGLMVLLSQHDKGVRLLGYQAYPNGNYFPVELVVAEESERYEDERTMREVEKQFGRLKA